MTFPVLKISNPDYLFMTDEQRKERLWAKMPMRVALLALMLGALEWTKRLNAVTRPGTQSRP